MCRRIGNDEFDLNSEGEAEGCYHILAGLFEQYCAVMEYAVLFGVKE